MKAYVPYPWTVYSLVVYDRCIDSQFQPKCHFVHVRNIMASEDSYFPPIHVDRQNINPPPKVNEYISEFRCIRCGEHFSEIRVRNEADNSRVEKHHTS